SRPCGGRSSAWLSRPASSSVALPPPRYGLLSAIPRGDRAKRAQRSYGSLGSQATEDGVVLGRQAHERRPHIAVEVLLADNPRRADEPLIEHDAPVGAPREGERGAHDIGGDALAADGDLIRP